MKRLFLSILTLIISLAAAYQVLSTWGGVHSYRANPSKEGFIKAIRLNSSNPTPFYRLGLFYQRDIRNVDLEESVSYIREAIERNPLQQDYWLSLARTFQEAGESNAAENALRNAILVSPADYDGRWMAGNLFLQQGALEKALPHFTYILANYPSQSGLVYDVLIKAVNDMDFILEKIVPRNPSSINQYIAYLYEIGDKKSLKKTWERKASYGFKSNRQETLRYIDFLISQGELNEAFHVWNDRLREEGLSIQYDGNLISNGGFEKEKILGGGFDWKIGTVSGAKISFDHSIVFERKSSLKIVFSGKENVDFSHVYQFVSLKPNTEYALRAHMKTEAVTTKSGLKIEISGIGPGFYGASETLIGDNEWKELIVSFRTPAKSQGGLVRVRREKTDKFDRLISGTVWIDNVRLTEKSH